MCPYFLFLIFLQIRNRKHINCFILLIFSTQFHIATLSLYLTHLHSQLGLRLNLKYASCRFLIKPRICFSISSIPESQSCGPQLPESNFWVWERIQYSLEQVKTKMTKYNSIRLNTVTKSPVFLRVKIWSAPFLFFCQYYYNLYSFCLCSFCCLPCNLCPAARGIM